MLYYKARWLIDSKAVVTGKVMELIHNCTQNGFYLKADGYETDVGYAAILFIVKVPDDSETNTLKKLGDNLGITKWDLCDENEYTSIVSLSFQDKWDDGTTPNPGPLMETIYSLGHYNAHLKDKSSQDDESF